MIYLKVVTVESKLETEDLGGISAGYVKLLKYLFILSHYLHINLLKFRACKYENIFLLFGKFEITFSSCQVVFI